MRYVLSQKIEIILTEEQKRELDWQSRMTCNMYNLLIDRIKESRENHRKYDFSNKIKLRNEVPKIKKENPIFYKVFSSPLNNAAFRLCDAYNRFLKDMKIGFPRYHCFRKEWFSLLYDEPNKGIKVNNKNIRITFGEELDENGGKKRLRIEAKLAQRIRKNISVKTYTIIKKYNRYYLCVTMEVEVDHVPPTGKSIALDFNHKNLFVGMDSDGKSIEMENLSMLEYFDKQIENVQELRGKCKHKEIHNDDEYNDRKHTLYYKKYRPLMLNLYHKRYVQVRQAMYVMANMLVKDYDTIVVGDYAPSIETAPEKGMRRKMMNESIINSFKIVLKHVCNKYGRTYIEVEENDTTKTCFNCGYKEKKDPSVREFICPKCGKHIYRDINSAINIGVKGLILSSSGYEDVDVSKPSYLFYYDWHSQEIRSIGN